MVKAQRIINAVDNRNKVDQVCDVCGKGCKTNRDGNAYERFEQHALGGCLRRVHKLRLSDAVALETIMQHHIKHAHHCGNHYTADCGCRRNGRNGALCREIFGGNAEVNAVKAALFFVNLYAPVVNKQRYGKTDAHLYNRFDNLRYRRGVHIAQALVISAVSACHTKEEHCRRKHNYRKKRAGIVAHRSRKELTSEQHNNAARRSGDNKAGHGNTENPAHITIAPHSNAFRNHSRNGNGYTRRGNGIKGREYLISGIVIAKALAAEDIHQRDFINCADNLDYNCGDAEDKRPLEEILFFSAH